MSKLVVGTVSTLVIAVSAVAIYRSLRRDEWVAKPNIPMLNTVGQMAAEETVKLVGGQGNIVVIGCAPGQYVTAERTIPLQVFQAALQKQPGVHIAATELVPLAKFEGTPGPGFSAELYLDLVAKYPDANLIVSFIGAPYLPHQEWTQAPRNAPGWLVVNPVLDGLRPLLEANVVRAAIVPGVELLPSRPALDQPYMVVTPTTTSLLPPERR